MTEAFLARLQFGLTIAFHYVFPPLSIGLGLILVIMEGMWLRTRQPLYREMTKFWVKVFALIFSIGVASGIVMEFQFGTNWSTYARFVGDVFGSALAAEGIFAFFLESGFLALLLFGWDRVGPKLHFFSTLMVALGSMFSAIWIIVADSWMQTPAGYHLVTMADGQQRAEVTDFWQVVFSPSSMERLWHTVMGAWQAAAWMVISVAAYYLLKKRHEAFAKASMKVGLCVALGASVLQLASGHLQAMIVAERQPAKLAAFEGHFAREAPAGLYLFGWVDEANKRVWGLQMPGMLSWLVHNDSTKPLVGLDHEQFDDPRGRTIPPVNVVFQTYHAMIGIGMTLILLSVLGVLLWWKGTLWNHRPMLRVLAWAVILPQAANQLGWFSAEVGRQPWIVYKLMRTVDGVSPRVTAGQIWGSLVLFLVMYALLFVLFIYLLDHKIRHGPDEPVTAERPPGPEMPLLQGDRAAT